MRTVVVWREATVTGGLGNARRPLHFSGRGVKNQDATQRFPLGVSGLCQGEAQRLGSNVNAEPSLEEWEQLRKMETLFILI